MKINNISLGSAQFGSKYGVTNKINLKFDEVKNILNYAYRKNIRNIDSAFNYGNAEIKLGRFGVKKWKVSSKFPKIPNSFDPEEWIKKCLSITLKRLKINNLETLFIHDTAQLKSFSYCKKIFLFMENLKKKGLIKKIGISIYSPEIINKIVNDFEIDVIQSPVNIFDQRIFEKKIQSSIKKNNISLELRSIFLQGLLLEEPNKIPKKFVDFYSYFKKIDNISKNSCISKIRVALSVLKNKKFNKLIIGVNSKKELKEILNEFKISNIRIPKIKIKNKNFLINPYLWHQKK